MSRNHQAETRAGEASGTRIPVMILALVSTKLPILLGQDLTIFNLPDNVERTGFWAA